MTTAEAAAADAYAAVERIVRKFKNLSPAARRAYNEDNTRKDFILPLFRALEWDIDNAVEVSAEYGVSRGWVDYAFRLNGISRFFLETKRVDEDLSDPRWVKQAIDYAWHKNVTWALLSDFEQLRVFNAEWQETNPFRAEFLQFDVEGYLTDFAHLWWLSRPETAAGTLDREAEKVGKKTRRLPVTLHLFSDLKTWRHELFQQMHRYNPLIPPAQVDEAVLRLLNRLIFIRTAEDRAVEPSRLLPLARELADSKRLKDLPRALTQLFREMDAVYNSELFAKHLSEDLMLECEPEPFRRIIEGLHERGFVRYNFSAIDADVLGTAYEQYLGHVITDPEAAEVVEKRQKRKSQGIYYTPTFVVKYIVRQTLGRYLDEHEYNPAHPVRVLDMACGSGSFLIEAFDLLDRHVAQQRNQDRAGRPDSSIHDAARRLELLTQCLYGVDKDKQAVEVARLNLLLRGLQLRDKLPMLTNLREGDSLISGARDELRAAFGEYWKEKRAFNWDKEFPEVFGLTPGLSATPSPDAPSTSLRSAQDARRERGTGGEGGFDVIVGNPPYVRAENMPREERDYYMDTNRFSVAYGRFDIHILSTSRNQVSHGRR